MVRTKVGGRFRTSSRCKRALWKPVLAPSAAKPPLRAFLPPREGPPAASPSFSKLAHRARSAAPSFSKKWAHNAPRESASSPNAPLPANASRTTASSNPPRSLASALMSDSLTRSVVGLVSVPFGAASGLPRHSPATIRMSPSCSSLQSATARHAGSLRPACERCSVFLVLAPCKQHAHLARKRPMGRRVHFRILGKHVQGVGVRRLDDSPVAHDVHQPQR